MNGQGRRKHIACIWGIVTAVMFALAGCGSQDADSTRAAESSQMQSSTQTQNSAPEQAAESDDIAGAEFETIQEAVANMPLGWNIGNALDSNGSSIEGDVSEWETAWGSPVITKELIQEMKASGFDVIRVPVTWMDHLDENNQVDEAWMNRVEEVVNYVMDEGMYCILNVHHDCGGSDSAWLWADLETIDATGEKLADLWTQIADRFGDYGERLLFEGYNEMLDKECRWGASDEDGYEAINQLAQIFVSTIRSTGGKNAQRNLIVCTYAASPGEEAVSAFRVPEDTVQNHLAVETHIYAPGRFTTAADWITDGTSEFDESCQKELDENFALMDQYFISRGYPVIIGEFGSQDKDNDEQRAIYANYVMREAAGRYGMSCIWWDDAGAMQLIDRRGPLWTQPGIRNGLTAGKAGKENFEMESVSQEAVQKLNTFKEPEVKGISLDRKNWKIETYANQDEAVSMTDGNISTAWANLEGQFANTEDQWIVVDLGSEQELNRVSLWTPNRDYTRAYEVYASKDGQQWELLAAGEGSREFTDIDFKTTAARWIRINQVGEALTNYWSVYELRMYRMD